MRHATSAHRTLTTLLAINVLSCYAPQLSAQEIEVISASAADEIGPAALLQFVLPAVNPATRLVHAGVQLNLAQGWNLELPTGDEYVLQFEFAVGTGVPPSLDQVASHLDALGSTRFATVKADAVNLDLNSALLGGTRTPESFWLLIRAQDPLQLSSSAPRFELSDSHARILLQTGPLSELASKGARSRVLGTWQIPAAEPPRQGSVHLQVYPNPANPAVTISYAAPVGGPISVEVFDLAGRAVSRQKLNAVQGDNTFTWRGVDSGGRNVSSGIYAIRISGRDWSATAKLTLLR